MSNPMRAGVEIGSVELKSDRLAITGQRLITHLEKGQLMSDRIGEEVDVEIAAPANGDYAPALKAIFAATAADLAPTTTDNWQQCLLDNGPPPAPGQPAPPRTKRAGKGPAVTAPVVLYAPEPEFPASAKRERINVNVLVHLEVDTCGNPIHVIIARGFRVDVDRLATEAVRKYHFKPATENGRAVKIEMDVCVNIQHS